MIACSQDSWIIHSNYLFQKTDNFNIYLGKPGCDNAIAYYFRNSGFKIYNCPYFIKTFHLHETKTRDYTVKDRINGNYLNVFPARDFIKIRPKKR